MLLLVFLHLSLDLVKISEHCFARSSWKQTREEMEREKYAIQEES